MSIEYNKTNWVNNVTKLNATNMNHIEDGIEAATNAINDSAGLEQLQEYNTGNPYRIIYNSETGASIDYTNATISYISGDKQKTDRTLLTSKLPIIPGKYISIDTGINGKTLEVKADDTELALNYYKIDKTQTTSSIPYWSGKTSGVLRATSGNVGYSVVVRDVNGSANFYSVKVGNSTIENISDSKGTSSTIALSQKGAADNYLPLTEALYNHNFHFEDLNTNDTVDVTISTHKKQNYVGVYEILDILRIYCETIVPFGYYSESNNTAYKIVKVSSEGTTIVLTDPAGFSKTIAVTNLAVTDTTIN